LNKLVALGRQPTGSRFMLGLTSLGDAQRFGLDTAALQSTASVNPRTKFTDATGRTFVAPTDDALRASAAVLQLDPATHVWSTDYAALRTKSAAYPGAMPVYLAVPTSGLPTAEAQTYANVLTYFIGPGQVSGLKQGQLPPGYLPLTSANKLGDLAAYSKLAAAAILAQDGSVPGVAASSAGSSITPPSDDGSTFSPLSNPPSSSESPSDSEPSAPAPAASSSAPTIKTKPASAGKTIGATVSSPGAVLVLLIALALLGPIGVPAVRFAKRLRSGP
jgi:hypothetical protein